MKNIKVVRYTCRQMNKPSCYSVLSLYLNQHCPSLCPSIPFKSSVLQYLCPPHLIKAYITIIKCPGLSSMAICIHNTLHTNISPTFATLALTNSEMKESYNFVHFSSCKAQSYLILPLPCCSFLRISPLRNYVLWVLLDVTKAIRPPPYHRNLNESGLLDERIWWTYKKRRSKPGTWEPVSCSIGTT